MSEAARLSSQPTRGQVEPLQVHCKACAHEWQAGELPMLVDAFVATLKHARCAKCGSSQIALGLCPRATPAGDPHAWIVGGDTGTSSETIWAVMMGVPRKRGADVPYDPDDFGRCYRLLKLMPEWRPRLPEVAAAYPRSAWGQLVDRWDEMTALYERVIGPRGNAWHKGPARELYDLMCELRQVPR